VDKTYVKVKGKWMCLYRAVDKHGNTIDFYLSPTRNKKTTKQLINPVRGFKTIKTAYATIKEFEIMRMFKKEQMNAWTREQDPIGEIRLIERQFYTSTPLSSILETYSGQPRSLQHSHHISI